MKIIGTGLDATEIHRIAESIERYGERFIQRIFTEGEIAYCRRKRDAASSFAARFAAKEAAMKALGTGHSRGVFWRGIEVVRHFGPPHHHAGEAHVKLACLSFDGIYRCVRFMIDARFEEVARHQQAGRERVRFPFYLRAGLELGKRLYRRALSHKKSAVPIQEVVTEFMGDGETDLGMVPA